MDEKKGGAANVDLVSNGEALTAYASQRESLMAMNAPDAELFDQRPLKRQRCDDDKSSGRASFLMPTWLNDWSNSITSKVKDTLGFCSTKPFEPKQKTA